jgi:hypothetical protein
VKPPCHDPIYMESQQLDCNRATHKAAMSGMGLRGIRFSESPPI